ncbi:serine hydrolase domain-containing protein [Metabacillus idriensis]|uniref:serine hydrolase domain-containing protein n=1 Tax=Metabacillus idriensis TaxID=324768 RepID=UPI00174D1DEA|nr:serine hydrolase domain-containing protein [Metabacillus idriensis]
MSLNLQNIHSKMDQHHIPGLALAIFKEGKIAFSKGYGVGEAGTSNMVTSSTLFHACSISKMTTAIGILRLVQDGMLDLEEDVNNYLTSWHIPENQFTKQKKVTLRNLLSHQGGFIDPQGSFDMYQEQDPLPTMLDIFKGKTRYHPQPLQVSYVPESEFSYSDAGYCVIEQVVEDVTGESFPAVMDQLVMSPLGLKDTYYWNYYDQIKTLHVNAAAGHSKNGHTVEGKRAYYPYPAGSGLWSTPSDLAKLALAVTDSWIGKKNSILEQDLACLMLTGFGSEKAAGLGVFLLKDERGPYFVSKGWGVGFQCMLIAYPRMQSGIAVMINADPGKPQNISLVGQIIDELVFGNLNIQNHHIQ